MKGSQVFPSKYLSKEDVTRPLTATIGNVLMEKIKGDGADEDKAVLHFMDEQVKSMILNKGNWATLEAAYGDESDHWRGKPVEVFVDPTVMYAGKRVGGLRLRVPGSVPTNGFVPTWTLEQAVAELAKVGMNRDYLISTLKAEGKTNWNSIRDTPTVQRLIASASRQDEQSFEDVPEDETMPF